MSTSQPTKTPGMNKPGETACGSRILVTPNTPYILYRDEIVYFCDQDCKDLYESDPLNSCMAARIISGR